MEVFVRFEVNRRFAVDRINGASHRFGHGRIGVEGAVGRRADGERFHALHAIHIGRTQFDRNALGRIFSPASFNNRCHRRVVDRRNRYRQRAARTGISGVADLRHFAAVILDRGERIRAVDANRDTAHACDNSRLARREGGAAHVEGGDAQHVVDVAVVAQHIAGGDVIFDDRVGIGDQNAGIIHGNNGGSGRCGIDRQVFVVAAGGTGNGGADRQVFTIRQVSRSVDTDRTGGFTGFDGDGLVVGQFDHNVGLRRVGHGGGVDDLATLIHRCRRGERNGGGVDGVVDLSDRRRRIGGDDQVAAAGRAGDGGGDRRGVQVRGVITGERDVQRARGLAGWDHNREAVGQGDGQVAGRGLRDEYGVNHNTTGFGDGRRGGQGDGDVARVDAVVVRAGQGVCHRIRRIQTVGRITDGRVDHAGRRFKHNKAMTAADSAVSTGCGRARGGGFEVLGRVGAGSDGLLQFGDGRCCLSSGGAEVGGRVRCVGAPLSVAAQIDHAAVGQFQRNGTGRARINLLPCEQAVAFYQQTTNPFWGYREHLTDNAFDDRNAAHKRLSVYCRSGVSTQETGPVSGADSISWSTQLLKKIMASIFCCRARKITFPSRY